MNLSKKLMCAPYYDIFFHISICSESNKPLFFIQGTSTKVCDLRFFLKVSDIGSVTLKMANLGGKNGTKSHPQIIESHHLLVLND